MRRALKLLLIPALLATLLPLAGAANSAGVKCPDLTPPPLKFGKPIYIDKNRAGGEPVSITAQDGSISVSAHAGTTHIYKAPDAAPGAGDFLIGYTNQTLNWRSTDGGKTWKYVGFAGTETGPHSAQSTGFSDPDFSMDASGRIYNVEIDLANVAVFSSSDDGQSYPRANPVAGSGDRPWVTGAEADEVFLYINLPKQLWRSTDGGLTYSLVGQGAQIPVNSKLAVDPRNPKQGLIGPIGTSGIAISEDDGVSWEQYPMPKPHTDSTQFFGTLGVDREGHVYSIAAGGYNGSSDTTQDGAVTFAYFDREKNKWGPGPVKLDIPKGDAMWPWIIAGDDGRVAMTWYQTLNGNQNKFYAMAAYTLNGHGSMVTCSDGKKHYVPPQFSVVNASKRPIHKGQICLSGTSCNANPNFEGGDRRLGDFFTINFDHKGNIYIASGDTMLQSPTGGEKPVGNPIFIRQSSGASMLEKPDKIRKTRPLCATPNC